VPEHEALRKVVRRLALEALESCDEAEHEDREKRAVDRGTPPS
jgi:hypothetical protein